VVPPRGRIHSLHCGEVGGPAIVFVHGGAAHAHGWSFIAPLFVPDDRVAAIDLSGHGDRERRDRDPRDLPFIDRWFGTFDFPKDLWRSAAA